GVGGGRRSAGRVPRRPGAGEPGDGARDAAPGAGDLLLRAVRGGAGRDHAAAARRPGPQPAGLASGQAPRAAIHSPPPFWGRVGWGPVGPAPPGRGTPRPYISLPP